MSNSSARRDRATRTAAISSSAPVGRTTGRRVEPEPATSSLASTPRESCGPAKSGCRKASSAAAFAPVSNRVRPEAFSRALAGVRSSAPKASSCRTPWTRSGTEFAARSRLNHFFALVILRLTAPPAPCHRPPRPGASQVALSRSTRRPIAFIRRNRTMKTALVFPGQGSQPVGMGKALADEFRVAREIFDRVDGALDQKLSHLMFEGPEDQLTLTANAQPALMATSIAALKVLEIETGFNLSSEAAYVAGHSLGEYSALCAADSLTLEDAARLLRLRGEAMQKAVPVGEGAMAAILGLDFGAVVKIATQAASDLYLPGAICQAANDNGGGQVVVSGTVAAVERAIELAKLAGAKRALLLPVSAPFHCALMQPAAAAMEEALKDVTIRPPTPPLVSNVEAEAVTNPDAIRSGLVAQVTATVRWRDSVTYMSAHGVTRFIELGSGKVLTGLIKRIVESGATTISISAPTDIAAFRASAQP